MTAIKQEVHTLIDTLTERNLYALKPLLTALEKKPMNGNTLERAFIDTCVFVYLYSNDEPEKKTISENMVNNYDCAISTQVLNEFSSVCIRKKTDN
ncbi:hypothetical protein FACS1894200_10660 [Spirochaetia bacterium]|nr:hypothetical protein FACS1894200_10660 [Spirochaetia bacterium]